MKFIVAAIVLGTIPSSVYATVVERQTIQMTANISAPNISTLITPTAGSWPTAAQVVSWSGSAFNNPAPIGFTVKSDAEVSLSLSSVAALVDGQAKIPLKVAISATSGTGTAVPELTMLPQSIYTKPAGAGTTASYTLDITAESSGMTDVTGATVAVPAPGNYTGAVALVFDATP